LEVVIGMNWDGDKRGLTRVKRLILSFKTHPASQIFRQDKQDLQDFFCCVLLTPPYHFLRQVIDNQVQGKIEGFLRFLGRGEVKRG